MIICQPVKTVVGRFTGHRFIITVLMAPAQGGTNHRMAPRASAPRRDLTPQQKPHPYKPECDTQRRRFVKAPGESRSRGARFQAGMV